MDFLRLHQTSSKCNLNIQNIILNWYGKIVKSKKYEKFQNAGGGQDGGGGVSFVMSWVWKIPHVTYRFWYISQ